MGVPGPVAPPTVCTEGPFPSRRGRVEELGKEHLPQCRCCRNQCEPHRLLCDWRMHVSCEIHGIHVPLREDVEVCELGYMYGSTDLDVHNMSVYEVCNSALRVPLSRRMPHVNEIGGTQKEACTCCNVVFFEKRHPLLHSLIPSKLRDCRGLFLLLLLC